MRSTIAAALRGRDALDQAAIDAAIVALDGTPNKARLGGNATVAVSMAVAHAAAMACGVPLWKYLAGNAAGHGFRCPRFRSSAAAPTPAVASTCRTSW